MKPNTWLERTVERSWWFAKVTHSRLAETIDGDEAVEA